MRFWRRAGLTVLLLTALVPLPAHTATLSGSSSTVMEWSDQPDGETTVEAYQYLRLNAKDLPGGMTFRGYGRWADEIHNEDGSGAESRLYYAYLEKPELLRNLDLRLGRQFISSAAGASLLDGIKLDYDGLGPVALSLYGGGDVSYYEGYSTKDWLVGATGSLKAVKGLDASLSYLQQWDDGDLAREMVGLDLNYALRPELDLYSEVQYSWLTAETTYFLGGIHYHRQGDWSLRGEYLYSLPVFSATSLYSVFAASEYREASLEANLRLRDDVRAYARYSHEFYREFDDASITELGIEKLRRGRFSGYLAGSYRKDEEGQDLYGVKVRAACQLHPKVEAGVGAHIDVLERRIEEDDETTSQRIWADLTTHLTRTVDLQGKVERIESDLWEEYYQGRVRLNISF